MICVSDNGYCVPEIEVIADYACEIGENPLWHPLEQCLYWTDISGGQLFRFEPKTGQHSKIYQGRPVGGFTFQMDGSLLLFRDSGSISSWRNGRILDIVPWLAGESDSRFNDVIADPVGRVFCGTMSTNNHKGRLYLLNLDGTISTLLEDIGCSNGMGFTPDRHGFYHTDSFTGKIHLFDYEITNGSISNPREFASIPSQKGMPDGLAVDSRGCVWSAIWDGWSIHRFLPCGDLDRTLRLPAKKISSLTFGGRDLRDIYVTTAGGNARQENGSVAGALLRFRSQVQGVPEFFSRIRGPS